MGSNVKENLSSWALEPTTSTGVGELEDQIVRDPVFGDVSGSGPNYRGVGWLGAVALMMKTQVGLGVLAIPVVFGQLGMVTGIICLLSIATITTWSNYIVGVFKLNHPEIYGIDDVGKLIFGRVGEIILGAGFFFYYTFAAGSGMLSISISLNALSNHGTCTAIFVAVAAITGCLLSSIRTLSRITFVAWIGLAGILVAVFAVAVAVGVEDRPEAAPQDGPWISDYQAIRNPDFVQAISAVSTLVFAYAGTPGFFPIASEMRDPRQYTKALIICQTGVTITYLVIGIVVYYFCGSYVATPALGSAGPLMKKVCYGIALPGLLATTTLVIHFPAKYVFVRTMRGSKHLNNNSYTHWLTWLACTIGVTVLAYTIASAIPVFGGLVSLIGALLGTLLSFQPMGFMWLYDNWSLGKSSQTLKWRLTVVWCAFVIISGSFLMVAGTYSATVDIANSYRSSKGSVAWSCADNSNSS